MEKVMEIADAGGAEREPKRSKGGKANARSVTDQSDDCALTDFGFLYCVAMLSYKGRSRVEQPSIRYEAVQAAWECVHGDCKDLSETNKLLNKERICKKITNYFYKNRLSVAEFMQKAFVLPLNSSKFGLEVRALWGLSLEEDEVPNIWAGKADFLDPAGDLHMEFLNSPRCKFLRGGNFRQYWTDEMVQHYYSQFKDADMPEKFNLADPSGPHDIYLNPETGGAAMVYGPVWMLFWKWCWSRMDGFTHMLTEEMWDKEHIVQPIFQKSTSKKLYQKKIDKIKLNPSHFNVGKCAPTCLSVLETCLSVLKHA